MLIVPIIVPMPIIHSGEASVAQLIVCVIGIAVLLGIALYLFLFVYPSMFPPTPKEKKVVKPEDQKVPQKIADEMKEIYKRSKKNGSV